MLDQYVRGWMGEETVTKNAESVHCQYFCLTGLYCLVRGKWLTAQMWDRYINNNNPLSDASILDVVMLQHAVSKNNEIKITYL